MRQRKTISKVYLWGNSMVMVFDQNGEQMPRYQGRVDLVAHLILRNAPASTTYFMGVWGSHADEITRDQFVKEVANVKV